MNPEDIQMMKNLKARAEEAIILSVSSVRPGTTLSTPDVLSIGMLLGSLGLLVTTLNEIILLVDDHEFPYAVEENQ